MAAKTAKTIEGVPREVLRVADVYAVHAEFVYKTLFRMGVPEADLPDLLQEVFITVHRRRDSFDGSSTLRTWLYAICRGMVANHRRKAHRRREQMVRELPELPDPTDPEAKMWAQQARRTVHRLLDGLDPDRRVVFVMFEVEGRSGSAIAASLGIPLGTVYSRLRLAREDFSRALGRLQGRGSRR